jgi:hypothetical protein
MAYIAQRGAYWRAEVRRRGGAFSNRGYESGETLSAYIASLIADEAIEEAPTRKTPLLHP